MIKIYGSDMCPDCIECKADLNKRNVEFEYADINESLQNLKDFLLLRDSDPAFNDITGSGYIGIPAIVTDDKRVLLDWDEIR